MLECLRNLEQAEHIRQPEMENWTAEAVETVMAAVTRSWRIPDPAAGPEDRPPSAWDGAGHQQWLEVIDILCDELAALTAFTPEETSRFCTGGTDAAWHLQRAVQAKLLLVQGTAAWSGKWRSLRRRLSMKLGWRGGVGLNPDAGWCACIRSATRLGRHLGAQPTASWLPGLLRQAALDRSAARLGWSIVSASPGGLTGRLVLVEYLYPGRKQAAPVAAGVIPDDARLRLSIQYRHCVSAGIVPAKAGFCVFDQDEQRWHFHEAEPSLEAAGRAEARALEAWQQHVMKGRPPLAGVPAPDPESGPAPSSERGRLATAWIAGIAVAAGKEHEAKARAGLEELLKRRLATAGRKARTTSLDGICAAELDRSCSEDDLRRLGLNPDDYRSKGTAPSAAKLLTEIERIRVSIGSGQPTAEQTWDQLSHLIENPPLHPGGINLKAAMDALGDRVGELPETSLRLTTADPALRQELLDRFSALLGSVLGDAVDELVSGPAADGGTSPGNSAAASPAET